ncbi:metallophosphoesterase family protein [Paracraurococcus lichenis]|uniref:Metallophosphoesterase family protein n=1 Tax=Paracraurococcus lichenis TaxID=3064888 RepID=A0ABT9DU61_9PROT|nr:metallophosphoesterase family protein [Paracraurococcus sp. LOR1-02]MDO9707434.1 metallophosphoesterase family protein [Paracraurococcus sp. LOR1-02]
MIAFQPAPGRLPPGQRVYAIGDVHGCDDRLARLHAMIAEDLAARPAEAPLLLHVGDFVDRGPDSAGVVQRLAGGSPLPGLPMVNLMGNHERTMLDALAGERAAITDWRISGGREALASWGLDADADPAGWIEGIPGAHLDFLNRLDLHHRLGGYLFVHAGLRPGIPLEDQAEDDLLRIRGSFLNSDAEFGAVVVHGHSPSRGPVVKRNRIGIDTGAVFGRELTCLVLEADRLAFLSA